MATAERCARRQRTDQVLSDTMAQTLGAIAPQLLLAVVSRYLDIK